MPRPAVANSGGLILGALVGAQRGAPAGAVLTNGKQPLEEAMVLEAQRLGWSSRAIHWLTKRELEVALQRGDQPLQVLRLKVGRGPTTKEVLDDEIYDQFCEKLRDVEVNNGSKSAI